MKRPIAELSTMVLKAGQESVWTQHERELWQILRRKQGYVTHRLYRGLSDPARRLAYAEWESKKAADGSRQRLQATPVMRRARALAAEPPQRLIVELSGPVTSTKGIDLPDSAVAASLFQRLPEGVTNWREQEEKLWKALSVQPGHISTVMLRGFDDPQFAGAFSHWVDIGAFEAARASVDALAGDGPSGTGAWEYLVYRLATD